MLFDLNHVHLQCLKTDLTINRLTCGIYPDFLFGFADFEHIIIITGYFKKD